MPVSRFRLFNLAAAIGLASPLAIAQTTINLNTANGACIAVTDSAGLTLDPTPGSTALQASGVSLTANQEGACEVAGGGGPSADFGAELHISATSATDTPYTPVAGTPFYVIWSATSDAQRCTRGGFAASGWTPGTTTCTGAACTGRHAEQVTVTTGGQYNFSVTCTNATGYAMLPAVMDFPPPTTPVPTPNPITLTVPPNAIAGTAFAVTWPQMQNATRCEGSGTLAGVNAPNLGDWTALDTVATSRSVTVPAGSTAGTLQLTLECWNGNNPVAATGVSSAIAVAAAPTSSCPATLTTPYGQRTRVTTSSISYGIYPTVRPSVNVTEWDNIWGHNTLTDPVTPWPGVSGSAPVLRQFARAGYIGAHFRTPATMPSGLNGGFLNPSGVGGPNVIIAISRTCGDFSANLPAPSCLMDHRYGDPPGSGVPTSDGPMISWRIGAPSSWCTLEPNTDYYLNLTFADPTSTVECPSGATTCLLSPKHNWGN